MQYVVKAQGDVIYASADKDNAWKAYNRAAKTSTREISICLRTEEILYSTVDDLIE